MQVFSCRICEFLEHLFYRTPANLWFWQLLLTEFTEKFHKVPKWGLSSNFKRVVFWWPQSNRDWLIRLNSVNVRSEIWRQSLKKFTLRINLEDCFGPMSVTESFSCSEATKTSLENCPKIPFLRAPMNVYFWSLLFTERFIWI